MSITISDESVRELVRSEVARLVRELEPIVRAELREACQVVTEERGIQMLAISGKDPKRTFRRLMNKWRVQRVPGLGWNLASLQQAMYGHTIGLRNESGQLVERIAA